MRIVLANDTGAHELKMIIKKFLIDEGHAILDCGTLRDIDSMDYVTAGKNVAEAIQRGDADRGIAFCGSGAGVMTVANKYKGIYAVVCESVNTAKGARLINDANVLCMGANVVESEIAKEMTDIFLATEFACGFDPEKKERLQNFIDRIEKMEVENFA